MIPEGMSQKEFERIVTQATLAVMACMYAEINS
jgi:hypothetical protein